LTGGALQARRAIIWPDALSEPQRRPLILVNGEGVTPREPPTTFRIANLRARRDQSRTIVDFKLTGPEPKRIAFRCWIY